MGRKAMVLVGVLLASPGAAQAATVTGTAPAEAAGSRIVVTVMETGSTRVAGTQKLAEPGPWSVTVPGGQYMVHITSGDHFVSHSRIFRVAADAQVTPEMTVDKADAPPAGGSPPPGGEPAPPPASTPAPVPAPSTAVKRKKCKKPPPRCKKRRHRGKRACRKAKRRYKKCRKARTQKARTAALGRPAIGVKEFGVTVGGQDISTFWHLAIHGVSQSCIQSGFDHVDVSQQALDFYEQEVELMKQYGDPADVPDPSKRIHATHHITGEGSFDAAGNGTLTLHIATVAGTHVASVTASGHVFDVADDAARKLGELLCRKLRVQFTGERHNRLDVYACPPPNEDWFHYYDGAFVLDTPAANRFVWPRGPGYTSVTGTVSYTDSGPDGVYEDTEVTGSYLDVEPAGDGRFEFSLSTLSFNPALKNVGFTASWAELIAGTTTWPVEVTWDRHGTDSAGCTYDDDGSITGTFTVTPEAPAVALG